MSVYEEHYDEINAELRQMSAIAEAEQGPSPIFVGSGEDAGILFFQWKDIEHHAY